MNREHLCKLRKGVFVYNIQTPALGIGPLAYFSYELMPYPVHERFNPFQDQLGIMSYRLYSRCVHLFLSLYYVLPINTRRHDQRPSLIFFFTSFPANGNYTAHFSKEFQSVFIDERDSLNKSTLENERETSGILFACLWAIPHGSLLCFQFNICITAICIIK